MTRHRLAPRDKRALVIGSIALFVLMFVPRGGRAWLVWRGEAIHAASEMTHELARTRGLVAGLENALDSAEARTARFRDAGTAVFVARTPAQAAADLATAIREAARLSSVRLDAIQSRADTAGRGVLRGVTANVQATGDIAGLASMLQLLERRRPLLALRQLSVQPQSVETPAHAAESLALRLTVDALALIAANQKER